MKFFKVVLLFSFAMPLVLAGCFSKKQKAPDVSETENTPVVAAPRKAATPTLTKDKSIETLTRIFEQADGIHREAWWVLTSDKRPVGKSPFGKVQRALLSSENVKLTNKSLFRCDRYLVKRDVLAASGYPQKFEIFEKCSEKLAAKRIALVNVPKAAQVEVQFFPEGLEEILGLSSTILNKTIQCSLTGNSDDQLTSLKCKDWAQERSKEHMIRLDVYEYHREGQNMIKLRGKVYENLSDIRKIEADVPMNGKILVTETELYGPTPTPTPATTPNPQKTPVAKGSEQTPSPLQPPKDQISGDFLPPPIDPDVVQQQHLAPGSIVIPVVPAPGTTAPTGGTPVQAAPEATAPAAATTETPAANPADSGLPSEDGQTVLENAQPLPPDESQTTEQQGTQEQQQQQQQVPAGGIPSGR